MNIETIIKEYGHKITTIDLHMDVDGWSYQLDFIDKNLHVTRTGSRYPMTLDNALQNIHLVLWQNCN